MAYTEWNIPKELHVSYPFSNTDYGSAATHLQSAKSYVANPNSVFPQASAIKIPIAWELFNQSASNMLSLDQLVPVDPENGSGGCGILQEFVAGVSQISLADLAMLMIKLSDNVATNLLIDYLGMESINQRLEGLRLSQTRLRRKMMDFEARDRGLMNSSTPYEANLLLQALISDSQSTDTSTKQAAAQTIDLLSISKESPFTSAIPSGYRLASKPGMLPGLRTEWAIVSDEADKPIYSICIMIQSKDQTVSDKHLKEMLGAIAGAMHQDMTR